MKANRTKVEWWLPLIALVTPGSCYAYAAVFPSFRADFALVGAFLTIATVGLLVWRVLRPKQTDTHLFRLVGMQGFTLAALAIAYRFWLTSLDASAIAIGIGLLIIYALALVLPSIAPAFAERFYRDVWFPKSPLMRLLAATALALGGGAGAVGASMGLRASRSLGRNLYPFMAVLTTLVLFFATLYVSTGLRRQRLGQHPIPNAEG